MRKFNLDGYSDGTRIRGKRAIDLFLLQVMQMSNQETRGIAIALPFLQHFELRIGSWGRMRIRRDSLGLKFFLSFFLSKEFTFASVTKEREKDYYQGDTRWPRETGRPQSMKI